jgi:tripartite-type tricarboxylate transporter receptor subunit TctC
MTHTVHRRGALQRGLATLAVLGSPGARAQELPAMARLLVGFPPGTTPDAVARLLAERLNGRLARTVIVENRPGASGTTVFRAARELPPDGLTLVVQPAGVLTILPHSMRQLPYDPFADFTPVGLLCRYDFALAVGPQVPAGITALPAFVEWARKEGPKVTFATPGAGSVPHFIGDILNRRLNLQMGHVPYRGGGPAVQDLIGGQVSAAILDAGSLARHAKEGRIRLLGVTGTRRSPFAADTAAFVEHQVQGLDFRAWFGAYIVGRPAPAVLDRTAALLGQAVQSNEFAQATFSAGLEAAWATPAELDKLAREETNFWRGVVRESGFVADS